MSEQEDYEVYDNSNLENFIEKLLPFKGKIEPIKNIITVDYVIFENQTNEHMIITYRNILTIEKINEISGKLNGSLTGGGIDFKIVKDIIDKYEIKSWLYLPPGKCSDRKVAKEDIVFTPYIIGTGTEYIKIHGEEILRKGYKYYIKQEDVNNAIKLNNVLKFKLDVLLKKIEKVKIFNN
jgi:hypothetical protein